MDTQNTSVAEVPNLRLAKVGKDRERKRGGGGWLGARGAGSAFSGATGGAGAGMAGAGMSFGKILAILLVTGGISASAWKIGNVISANSAAAKPAAAQKLFADKDSGKYADTSGVIKQQNVIPNSLGYVNNDGLTDEQRAAKKAADEAAAAKAAADAQAKADADAKEKALADAKAASAAPDPAAAPAAAPEVAKKGLTAGKFGGMNSSFGGGGGGGGLSGGAGLSGGINRNFGAMGGLGDKGAAGALSAFRSPSKPSSAAARAAGHGHSNAKGFAKQQLDMANGMSRTALASGKTESASAGAGAPFDNNPNQGTVISGPGVGSGTQTGPADAGGSGNQSGGGGAAAGPIDTAACQDANYEPDANGSCIKKTGDPTTHDSADYQWMIDVILGLMAAVLVINILALALSNTVWLKAHAALLAGIMCGMGAIIMGLGATIALMKHGDFLIGGICSLIGGFICVQGAMAVSGANSLSGTPMTIVNQAAPTLIATAVGALAAGANAAGAMG
jgi:hypothetical protein